MPDSPNVSAVRRLYRARGNPEVVSQVLARDVRWEVVDGFPYSGVCNGLDNVLRDFFGRLFTDFDEFVADGSEFFESGGKRHPPARLLGGGQRGGEGFSGVV